MCEFVTCIVLDFISLNGVVVWQLVSGYRISQILYISHLPRQETPPTRHAPYIFSVKDQWIITVDLMAINSNAGKTKTNWVQDPFCVRYGGSSHFLPGSETYLPCFLKGEKGNLLLRLVWACRN